MGLQCLPIFRYTPQPTLKSLGMAFEEIQNTNVCSLQGLTTTKCSNWEGMSLGSYFHIKNIELQVSELGSQAML